GLIEVSYRSRILAADSEFLDSVAELLCFAINNRFALICSDESIRKLAGQMIQVQEAERSRIASELHDNVNQQIAALSITLSNIRNKLRKKKCEVLDDLADLQNKIKLVVDEIRNVSHHLHSGILHQTGLAAAARNNCNEFSE